MPPVLVTPPTTALVSLAEAKAHLRVDHSDEDALIATLISAATGHIDGYGGVLGRAVMPQTWAETWDCAGPYTLALPDADATSLAVTAAGVAVPPEDVTASLTDAGLVVSLAAPVTLPVRIEYECALPPEKLPVARVIVLMLIGHWYAHREAAGAPIAEVPLSVAALAAPLIWARV